MKGLLPMGPFDTCLREPLSFEFELDGARVSAVRVDSEAARRRIGLGFEGLTPEEGLTLAGLICARSSFAHSLAYCQALEDAAGAEPEAGAMAFRAIVAEYERIASHLSVVSDVGRALADDILYRGPRRYVARIREAFTKACGDPFGRGLVVPGGASVTGDTRALRDLSQVLKSLERDCGFWTKKVRLSGSRLHGGGLKPGSFDHGTPPAPALRAAGHARDTRSGENAYGYYAGSYYRPVVREGGTALDRVLLLLEEARAAVGIIRKASNDEGVSPGVPVEMEPFKGKGVGVSESPEGAFEHSVFLGDGRVIRDRVSTAVTVVASLAGASLTGVFYEDIAPAVISLYLCAPCLGVC